MTQNIESDDAAVRQAAQQFASRAKISGVISLVVGVLALASPVVAAAMIGTFVGIALVLGGVAVLLSAFASDRKLAGIIVGALTLLAGISVLASPGATIATLTLILAVFLIVAGVSDAIAAFQVKGEDGWSLGLWSGIISVIFGVLLWSGFPVSGLVAIGVFVGLHLIAKGLALLMLGSAVGKAA